ncbi:MAG: tRNA (adenosine(37)-N6)-threonylcarbamoyltransferase complex transferase subunit TsaD [Halobacteriovoraceae bacterium]|nr:tRNA (adenosine(37)-N6)-threonylcarbamoyltransferase complex transferase subunit TsaD [Halobacteriovoraceae bacterium]|tara:strand:+ start:12074 stop:13126 length:1053 start_codon:yes stop_codon:yes gene_type:complete
MTQIILGIETSCDDTSVALLKKTSAKLDVLSHLKFGQEESLAKWGGVVPEIAARNHLEKMTPLLEACFEQSNIKPNDLDAIAVTTVPGLLGPLLTGVNAAKSLALLIKKPIIPVNHLYAHLEAIHMSEEVSYPYLGLLISGGHSVFFWVESSREFKVLGSTIDDAAGEAFDKGGKLLGLGYPAGHLVDAKAKRGDRNKFDFPIGLKASADSRLSYSGLKTSLRVFLEKNPSFLQDQNSQEFFDLCASYQSAISKALLLKTKYAFKQVENLGFNSKTTDLVIGGGVACNSMIREDFKNKYPQTKIVKPEFCTDNGAMIAHLGLLNIDHAHQYPECLAIDARGRFIQKVQNG